MLTYFYTGSEAAETEKKILEEEAKIPSDFSDATTEDDIDLSKLTPAQRRQYLAEKERRRKEREQRRREKYGDKYDEIMKKKNALVFSYGLFYRRRRQTESNFVIYLYLIRYKINFKTYGSFVC